MSVGPLGAPRRRALVVWGILALLVALIAGVKYREQRESETDRAEAEASARELVPVSMSKIGIVELFQQGTLHRFERDAAGVWFYHGHAAETSGQPHAHQADPALAPAIEQIFLGFGRTRMERQFPRGALEKDYGTAAPELFIMIYEPKALKPLARYAVGGVAPDRLSRYVLPDGSPMVVTIPNYQVENLQALVRVVTGQMPLAQLQATLSGVGPGGKALPGAAPTKP